VTFIGKLRCRLNDSTDVGALGGAPGRLI
jgi:hypothetical protein